MGINIYTKMQSPIANCGMLHRYVFMFSNLYGYLKYLITVDYPLMLGLSNAQNIVQRIMYIIY